MGSNELAALKNALDISPDNSLLRRLYGKSLLKENFIEEAEKEFKQLLQSDPHSNEIKIDLVKIFIQLQKSSAAQILLEDILESEEQNAEANYLLAKILVNEMEFRLAYEHYIKAIQIDPKLSDINLKLAIDTALAQSGEALINHSTQETELESNSNVQIEKPEINFSNIGGLLKVKEDISLKVIYPLKNPELYKAYGKKIGGGIMLYGPPGCGKTLISRATAGEINLPFISIGLNEILDMWMGNSEKNLHEIFQTARRNAPCILFFDEMDALGANRSDMRQSAGRTLVNQFLEELDGVKFSNEGIMILGATNCPWYVDNAFKRPGRFDKVIFISPPDIEARKEILRISIDGIPQQQIEFDIIAKLTEGCSGADLKAIIEVAVEQKISESLKTGLPQPITTSDLKKAVSLHRPTTKEWFATAKNYALFSNESGLYDDILNYLKLKK